MGFLHVRGGVSGTICPGRQLNKFSPRAWRCFSAGAKNATEAVVFSTCVEVFLVEILPVCVTAGFLHVRGGVSRYTCLMRKSAEFSPRAWRCFQWLYLSVELGGVFSTCVEVFPDNQLIYTAIHGFLHVRGGVST